jgi:heme-degrading monooxygenase HmoA
MRIWRGRLPRSLGNEYEQFLTEKAVPNYSSVEGLREIYFSTRDTGDEAQFILVTIWDSIEAMTGFTGGDPYMAKYYPEDDEYLIEKTPYVEIYKIFYHKSKS